MDLVCFVYDETGPRKVPCYVLHSGDQQEFDINLLFWFSVTNCPNVSNKLIFYAFHFLQNLEVRLRKLRPNSTRRICWMLDSVTTLANQVDNTEFLCILPLNNAATYFLDNIWELKYRAKETKIKKYCNCHSFSCECHTAFCI